MTLHNSQFSILQLLPQSVDMKIKNIHEAVTILDISEKILKIADTSLLEFMGKKNHLFDPLVGENSCQIRAYMVYYFFHEDTNFNQIYKVGKKRDEINYILNRMRQLKKKIMATKRDFLDISFSEKSESNLDNFISRNQLEIFFIKEVGLLIMIYFLSRYTIVNKDGIHTGINYDNMRDELRFSKTLSRRLIHLYQVTVSNESSLFIKLLAKDISHYYPQYEPIVNLLTFTDDDGRKVISCYLTMDILLKHMSINSTPITIQQIDQNTSINQTHTASICYQLNHKSFQKLSLPKIKDNHPCIMFRGIGSFSNSLSLSEKLSVLGIQKTLLASTARHPQYPGKKLESLKDDPFSIVLLNSRSLQEEFYLKIIRDEFLRMKKWSLTHGCCMESPTTFFVTHIFCGNSGHYINTGYNQTMDYMDRSV